MFADSLEIKPFLCNFFFFPADGYDEIIQGRGSAGATQGSAAPRTASARNNFVITIHFKLFAQNIAFFFQAVTIFTAAQITSPTLAAAGSPSHGGVFRLLPLSRRRTRPPFPQHLPSR